MYRTPLLARLAFVASLPLFAPPPGDRRRRHLQPTNLPLSLPALKRTSARSWRRHHPRVGPTSGLRQRCRALRALTEALASPGRWQVR